MNIGDCPLGDFRQDAFEAPARCHGVAIKNSRQELPVIWIVIKSIGGRYENSVVFDECEGREIGDVGAKKGVKRTQSSLVSKHP